MLYHDYFRPSARGILNPEFVHELADQEDSPSGNVQKIFPGQRVGKGAGVKSHPFVSHMNFQPVFRDQKFDVNFFAGVLLVAMMDGINDGFVYGHLNLELSFFVEFQLCGNASGGLLGLFHILKLAFEDHLDDASFMIHQRSEYPPR